MFYDKNIQQNSVLSVPWQIGTNQKPLKKVELPKICSSLKKWMDVDMNEKKHISLRTSAILVHGAAKLYGDGATRLWADCVKFYDKILWTKVSRCSLVEEDSILNSSMEEQLNTGDEQFERSTHETLASLAEKSPSQRTSQTLSSKEPNPSEEQSQRSSQEASESVAEKSSLERTSQRQSSSRMSRKNKSIEDKRNSQKRRSIKKRTKTVSKDIPRRTLGSEPRGNQPSGSLEQQTENTYVMSRKERQKYARWNLNEKLPMAVVLTFGTTVKPKNIIVSNISG